jgi:hypothetical protein
VAHGFFRALEEVKVFENEAFLLNFKLDFLASFSDRVKTVVCQLIFVALYQQDIILVGGEIVVILGLLV